jgi:hypothetical protein
MQLSPRLKKRLSKVCKTHAIGNTLQAGATMSLNSSVVATVLCRNRDPIELVSKLARIEFAKPFDPTSFKDVYGYFDENGRQRRGLAHRIVASGEFGGRTASDIYDYASRRRAANDSAKVGQFKITENSPNTARITVGADQRNRRKKYVWERVGVQRQLAGLGAAGAVVGTALIHSRLSKIGGGSALTGLKNVFKGGLTEAKNIGRRAVGAPVVPFVAEKGPSQKLAEMVADQAAQGERRKQTAARAVATKLTKYGEKPELVPAVHPEGHAQAGQPILFPPGHPRAGQQKKTLRRRQADKKITDISQGAG